MNDPTKIRMDKTDYDGDGDTTEGIYGEVETMKEKLLAAMQTYATTKLGSPFVYDANARPYILLDQDADGKPDKDDKGANIAYNLFSPKLFAAGYNYHYVVKDPGAYIHNPKYVMQFLYDGIKDLGGSVTGMTRPK